MTNHTRETIGPDDEPTILYPVDPTDPRHDEPADMCPCCRQCGTCAPDCGTDFPY